MWVFTVCSFPNVEGQLPYRSHASSSRPANGIVWSVPPQLIHIVEAPDIGMERGESAKEQCALALIASGFFGGQAVSVDKKNDPDFSGPVALAWANAKQPSHCSCPVRHRRM